MGDPLKPVTTGVDFAPSARRENLINEMLRDWLNDSTKRQSTPRNDAPNGSTFLIINNSSDTIPQYGVLKWDSVAIHPADNLLEFKARLSIRGQLPDHNGDEARRPFFVVQEPLEPGGIGRAIGDGLTIAKVDVLDETHLYVECTGSTDHLQTAESNRGIATLHYRERTGTGVMYCVIRIGNPSGQFEDDGGKNNTNGCCCDEMQCLQIPGLTDDLCKNLPLWPEYYEFRLPAMDCRCTPAGTERKAKLYPVADSQNAVWESKHADGDPEQFTCKASNNSLESRTVTATWKWTAEGVDCWRGYSVICEPYGAGPSYTWFPNPNSGPPNWNPVEGSHTCIGCGGADLSGTTPPYTMPPCDAGHVGDTFTAPCVDATGAPRWVLQSLSIDGCDCTPAEPDFDGTTEGDTATTTCSGNCPTACAEVDQVAFWRLTIGTGVDYYGSPTPTKLELIVGSIARLTLYLDNPHRPFCPSCVNSFRTGTCKACNKAPSIICLTPIMQGGLTVCNECKDNIVPAKYLVYITSAAGDVLGPYVLVMNPDASCAGRREVYADVGTNPSNDLWGWLPGNTSEIKIDFAGAYSLAVEGGSTRKTLYTLDEDVTTGDGCNQVLHLTSQYTVSVSGLSAPDGSTMTLYPIPADTLP